MPRVDSNLARSVFYLYRRDPQTNEVTGPHGTGVMVGRESKQFPKEYHCYGVTNWHVACRLGASIIRTNGRHGVQEFEFDPMQWQFLKDGDDLAAVDMPDRDDVADLIAVVPEHTFVSESIITDFEIGPGDDTFMCGLFVSHHGNGDKIRPSFRFGNISMVADDDAPLEVETGVYRPCHLVDTRSRTGYSGSPVFVYRTASLTSLPIGWERDLSKGATVLVSHRKDHLLGLLGIHCGQFWDTLKVRAVKRTESEAIGDTIKEGDKLRIESAMTIVVPAWRISQLLDLEVFEISRKKQDERRERESDRRPQPEAVEGDLPSTKAGDGRFPS
jgi:hypothetical protein